LPPDLSARLILLREVISLPVAALWGYLPPDWSPSGTPLTLLVIRSKSGIEVSAPVANSVYQGKPYQGKSLLP